MSPAKSLGKFVPLPDSEIGRSFIFFHLDDAYFFWNEMVKNQATSHEESEIFRAYVAKQGLWEKKLGRLLCFFTGAPLLLMLALKKGAMWKIGGVYMYSVVFNAIYDSGIYF